MARNFNGGTDRISWDDPAVPNNLGCIAFWLKTTQTTTNTSLVTHWTTASRIGWGILLNNSANKVTASGWSGTAERIHLNSTTSVNDGNPHHIAFTFDRSTSGTCELYVDGTQEASGTNSSNWNSVSTVRPVQAGDNEDAFWASPVADMWEIGHWLGSKLAAAEIASLAKGFSPQLIKRANLRMYAPLIRDEHDIRNALAVTVVGTTVVPHGRIYYAGRQMMPAVTSSAVTRKIFDYRRRRAA